MALGLMIPAMFSGKLQELMGYEWFFVWVMLATIPSFLVTGLIDVDPHFGRKAVAELEKESL
jgi:PAT family beta-lactamase induction signal transducer AmpG